ncbi:MAG TPA: cytochrome C oxidase subunit II [Gallionella sp.]|jgi:cytochrome c oxidase subunit 2|nr:cytochrome C oxidase subunit II [Gallionella sp.]
MSQQQIAWQLSLILMSLVVLAFAFVAINSNARQDDYTPLQKRAYRIRSWLFWGLAVVFGSAMFYTLKDLPYGAEHDRSDASAAQIVEAKGYQWHWELSRDHIEVGQPVEFRITSADVNHGFGIYDGTMHIVAQAQAMPGYTNVIRHTFNKAGTYKILCLEYCGIAHHNMIAEIKVGSL